MAELEEKIKIVVSADASQSDRVLRQVAPTLGQHGRTAGDAWGRNFHSATDKWMRAIGGVLRRYGGDFGRQIAEGLEISERFGKAFQATERAAIGTGVGTFAGQAGATALGARAAFRGKKDLRAVQNIAQNILGNLKLTPASRKTLVDIFPQLASTLPRGNGSLRQGELPFEEGFPTRQLELPIVRGANLAGKPPVIGAVTGAFSAFSKVGVGVIGVIAALGAAFVGAIVHMGKAREEMRKLAKEAGLTVGVFAQLKDDKEFLDIWKKFGDSGFDAAKKIGKIRDPLLRTQAIIKEFGNDGVNTFYKLTEASTKYARAQKEVNTISEGFKDALMFVKQGIVDNVKAFVEWNFHLNIVKDAITAIKLRFLDLIGITPKLVKDIASGEAEIEKMTARLQEKRKQVVEDFIKKLNLQQDINQEILKMLEKQVPLEAQVVEKRKLLNQLGKEALKDKEKELQYYKLLNDLKRDEEELEKQKADSGGGGVGGNVGATSNALPFGLGVRDAKGQLVAPSMDKLTLSQRAALDPALKDKLMKDYFKGQNIRNMAVPGPTDKTPNYLQEALSRKVGRKMEDLMPDILSGKVSPLDAANTLAGMKLTPMEEALLRYENYRKVSPYTHRLPSSVVPPTTQEQALNMYKKQLELSLKPKDAIENLQIDTLQLLNTMIKSNANRIPIVPVMTK